MIVLSTMEAPNTNSASLPPDEDLTEVRKPASLLIAQFFLFPLIIIGLCVGIFLFFGYLTYEQRTPADYLGDIRSGTGTQRWQAAFELSNAVKSNPERVRTPAFVESLLTAYKDSPDEDIRVRRYLALILGEMKERSAVPALVEELNRAERLKTIDWSQKGGFQFLRPSLATIADDLVQDQIYTLWALGSIGDNSAVPGVMEQVKNQDASVRKIAAYVAGVLGDPRAVEGLLPLLSDPKEDVRWNAALALALLGNADGTDLLMKLLDHSYAETLLDITVEEKNQLRVNSIKALAKLKHEPAQEKIREVSENDPVLAVRSAALEALKTF
jgi:HEAT repeat protein